MDLSKLCKKLLIKEPFWGIILLGINKSFSDNINTLCVKKLGIGLEILINKKFWENLTDDEQIACFLHELHHICFSHMFMYDDFTEKERLNIAADLEVNCYINNLPSGAVTTQLFNFPTKKGLVWYYTNLPNENISKQNDITGIDDHSFWKEFCDYDEAQKALVQHHIDGLIKSAAEYTMKQRGTIPQQLQNKIDDLLKEKPRIYDWKTHFRRILGNELEVKFKKTYQKSSKRFDNSPGIKLKKRISILVGIDTSGSVSEEELIEFFSEVMHIYKAGARVHIIECDAAITKEWDFTGFQNIDISGRGGTDFVPVIDYYRQHRNEYTTLIFFTDGEAPIENLNVPNNNMTWIITSSGAKQDYPGKVIYIPSKD